MCGEGCGHQWALGCGEGCDHLWALGGVVKARVWSSVRTGVW